MESANYILQQLAFSLIWTALAFSRPGNAGTLMVSDPAYGEGVPSPFFGK
jgi:hypothetical protein